MSRRDARSRDGMKRGMTYREIGAVLGLSPARITQIEAIAIAKIKAEAARLGLDIRELLEP